MKKSVYLFLLVIILCLLGVVLYNIYSTKTDEKSVPVFSDEIISYYHRFSDGLYNPDTVTNYDIDDFDIGVSQRDVYYIDINNDNIPDRITKTFFDTADAHSYYEYKIELNNGKKYVNITPKNFRTVNGATCDFKQIQFIFKPEFKIKVISREMGDTWDTPTVAYEQDFILSSKNKIIASKKIKRQPICDVKKLF